MADTLTDVIGPAAESDWLLDLFRLTACSLAQVQDWHAGIEFASNFRCPITWAEKTASGYIHNLELPGEYAEGAD